jgi:hypothetical protein
VSVNTLPRLAEALRVSQEWLTTGRGAPPKPTGDVPPFPRTTPLTLDIGEHDGAAAQIAGEQARHLAVAWARASTPPLPEEAIQRVTAAPLRAYTAEEWLAAIRLEAANLRIVEKGRQSRAR